jgi:hypothetical protein
VPDLEDRVQRAWNPLVRPIVAEAWRCYNAGAVRASIAETWTAVTADLIGKITGLADAGDGAAQGFRGRVEAARAKGVHPDGVREMQAIEAGLLEEAERLELIDSIGVRELARIRDDRHLSVHPSLRSLGDVYEPQPEVARAHLAVALETLLTHQPTQGRKVLDQFTSFVCEALFSPSSGHIVATYFQPVRVATRRNIVRVAAKHALYELPVPQSTIGASIVADRMATCLKAFAERDRDLVRSTMEALADHFRRLDGEVQSRALARLGDQDFFWDMVDEPLEDRLDGLVAVADVGGPWGDMPTDVSGMLAIVRDDIARNRLASLTARFEALASWHKAQVAAVQPAPYFTRFIADLLAEAWNYRSAERIGQDVVLRHGPYYRLDELREVLNAWSRNDQCRLAKAMPRLVVELLAATVHLGNTRFAMFREFLDFVRTQPDGTPGTYYGYDELEAALVVGPATDNGRSPDTG